MCRISTLIEELKSIKKEHGDINIFINIQDEEDHFDIDVVNTDCNKIAFITAKL